MGIMEARSPRQIREKFKDLYQTALIANWKVWPVAQVGSSKHLFFSFSCLKSNVNHSLSISAIRLLPIVFRSRKLVEFSGRCTCLF